MKGRFRNSKACEPLFIGKWVSLYIDIQDLILLAVGWVPDMNDRANAQKEPSQNTSYDWWNCNRSETAESTPWHLDWWLYSFVRRTLCYSVPNQLMLSQSRSWISMRKLCCLWTMNDKHEWRQQQWKLIKVTSLTLTL